MDGAKLGAADSLGGSLANTLGLLLVVGWELGNNDGKSEIDGSSLHASDGRLDGMDDGCNDGFKKYY